MKKAIVIFMSLVLLCSATLPVGAVTAASTPVAAPYGSVAASYAPTVAQYPPLAEPYSSSASDTTVDERLAAVTLKVKEIFGIGDEYTEFNGSLSEYDSKPLWYLYWSSTNGNLEVSADENGKIYSYNLYNYTEHYSYSYDSSFAPAFPSATTEQIAEKAYAFLTPLLASNESVTLEQGYRTLRNQNSYDNAYFYGTIKINGLDSPYSVSLEVRLSDLQVIRFYRNESGSVNEIPSPEPEISEEKAAILYKSTFKLEPYYILTGNATEKEAILVYQPQYTGNYVVNAKTGELVDLQNKTPYPETESAASGSAPAMNDTGGTYLSPVELEGISKLEDVMSKDELDAYIRSISVLGVTNDFSFQSASYLPDKTSGEVYANISFSAPITDFTKYGINEDSSDEKAYRGEIYRNFCLNAKTGAIISCNTYYSAPYNTPKDFNSSTPDDIPENIKPFLQETFGGKYDQSALFSSSRYYSNVPQDNFTFSQIVNGYFYQGNYINVTVNPVSGYIDSLYSYWDDTITFAPAGTLIGTEKAISIYADAFTYKLSYLLNSTGEKSGNYYGTPKYEMLLAYTQSNDSYIYGVNALTGELIESSFSYYTPTLSYDDIDSCYAKDKIETLAEYGVGFYGGSFMPDNQLTQLDMILLLLSADGHVYDPSSFDEYTLDSIYQTAQYYNIIERGDKAPERLISRAALTKAIISMSGYGKAAELPGIYYCGFADDNDIPPDLYGYVAIAKGLNVISGDQNAMFFPTNPVTRQEAAVMYYNFMARA